MITLILLILIIMAIGLLVFNVPISQRVINILLLIIAGAGINERGGVEVGCLKRLSICTLDF